MPLKPAVRFRASVWRPLRLDAKFHLETARGAFDSVGQTDDGAFLRLWFRSAVTKTFFVHLWNIVFAQLHDFAAGACVFMLLKCALIEITDHRCAVMLLDNIDDALI